MEVYIWTLTIGKADTKVNQRRAPYISLHPWGKSRDLAPDAIHTYLSHPPTTWYYVHTCSTAALLDSVVVRMDVHTYLLGKQSRARLSWLRGRRRLAAIIGIRNHQHSRNGATSGMGRQASASSARPPRSCLPAREPAMLRPKPFQKK